MCGGSVRRHDEPPRGESARVDAGGIKGPGLIVRGRYVCARCERSIVEAQPGAPVYDHFVEKLKLIWDGVEICRIEEG